MSSFGISMGISPREPVRRVGLLAKKAEDIGIDALWVLDSQLIMRDVYVCLATAALNTDRIKLGTGVTNPFTRHITVTANAISTVDELSSGRAMLGLGSGDSSIFPLGLKTAKVDFLRQDMIDLRTLLNGEAVTFAQDEVRVKTTRANVPIYLAATQPRMLRLAGALADGVIVLGFAMPELVNYQLEFLYEGLKAAGRSRDDIVIDYWATISIRDDELAALNDVRSWSAGQGRWLNTWKTLPPALAPYREEAERAAREYDFSEHLSVHAEHGGSVSDRFTLTAAIAGNHETCVRRVRDLANLDLDRITLTLLSGGREERLERIDQLIKDVAAAEVVS